MSKKQPSTLAYIQEMFKDKVDDDVIKLVFTECQYNVEKAVMQLLSLSENTSGRNNAAASSSHKLDGIDPVDIPLSDMQQYLTPVTKTSDASQLDASTFIPQTQHCHPLSSTCQIPFHNNPIPGTAWPVIPNYAASKSQNYLAGRRISPKKAKLQSDSKLVDVLNINETYVSDDDIDDHTDFIDRIPSSSNVNQNRENHGGVKDTNIVKQNIDHGKGNENSVKQSGLNSQARNKGNDEQLFLNSKVVRPNNPKLKQMSKLNGNRTTNPHPFPPQAASLQNQSYLANQARFFPRFPPSFSNPFMRPLGNVSSEQYYRPHSQPRPPVPHQLIPPGFITPGNKPPNYSLTPPAVPVETKKPKNHSLPISKNTSTSIAANTTSMQGLIHPTQSIGPSQPVQATTHANKGQNHQVSVTSTHGSKGNNHFAPTTTNVPYGNKGSNHLPPTSGISHGRKRSNNTTLTTTSMTYGKKEPNPLGKATTLTHNNRQLTHSISDTFKQGDKEPNIPIPTNSFTTYSTIVTDSSGQVTHGDRQPIHSIPINSSQGTKGLNYPTSTTTSVLHGNKRSHYSLSEPTITHGSKAHNHPIAKTSPRENKASSGSKESNPAQSTTITHDGDCPNHPRSMSPTKGSNQTIPVTVAVPYDKKVSGHRESTMGVDKGSNHVHREQSKSEERVQAKFSCDEKKFLTILRGLPGSGKTHLARQLSANRAMILSTDDYFEKGNNRYLFNPQELSAAHEWNQNRAKTFMEAGFSPIIIDNTNTQSWEMRPYVLIALKCGYKVEIKEPDTWWKFSIKELTRRNIHGVTSDSLERMLERYEKNVTVQGIANSSSMPVTVPESDGKENHRNMAKQNKDNKQECMSNKNKLTNVSKKLSQSNGDSRKPNNSQTKLPTTARKTISLSANFSALRGSSKGPYRETTSAKHMDKSEGKDVKNNTAQKDLHATENVASVGENIELNMNDALASIEKQNIHHAVVSCIDKPIDEQEASEENSVPQVDTNANNKLNILEKSESAAEASISRSKSDLRETANMQLSASQEVQQGAFDEGTHQCSDRHEDSDGFKSQSDMNSIPAKSASANASANLGEECKNTSPEPEKLLSNEGTSLLCDPRVLESDYVTGDNSDYMSDDTQCISDRLTTECSSGNTQEEDLVSHSYDDTQFSYTEKEAVNGIVITQTDGENKDKQGENKDNSRPSNEQVFPQNEAPLPDLHDSSGDEGTGVLLQTDLSDLRSQNIDDSFTDVEDLSSRLTELTTDSSVTFIDNAKNEALPTTAVEEDSSFGAMIDTDASSSVFRKEHFPTSFSFKSDTCDTNNVQSNFVSDPVVSKDNAQYSTFHIPVEAMSNSQGDMKDHNGIDIVADSFNSMIVSDTTTPSHLPDVVTNPTTDTFSDAKSDASNIGEVNVGENDEQESGCVNLEPLDNDSNNSDIIKQDPVITLTNISCKKDTTMDSSSVIQSSKNDLERVDFRDEADSVSVDLHDSVMRDSSVDQIKTNLKDDTFCNREQITDNEKTSSDADKNGTQNSVQFLEDCFPHIEVDLLKSFLDTCNGNLIKTVDCLLEYNKNDYEAATSEDPGEDVMNKYTTRKVLDNYSPKLSSVSSPGCYPRVSSVSPNENCERDVASGYLDTPGGSRSSPRSESSTPRKCHDVSVDSLHLTLDPALAYQLLEMFGAFSGVSAKDPLSEDARTIRIDKDFAKILYTKWRKTVQAKNKAKRTDESKTFSPSGLSDNRTRRRYKTLPQQFCLPDPVQTKSPKTVTSQPEPISLKEIMDEQLAIHVSQSDQEIEKRYLEEQLNLSTKLKRSRLHGMFPGIDPAALNDIFQANNYDLDTTILQVQSSCGMPVTGKSTAVIEHQSFTNHHSPSNKQNDFQSQKDSQTDVDGNFQSFQDPSYQDYRAEAQTHFELRTAAIKKAALAYSKKQGELAKIYADQARQHGEKIKEANRRAAEKIIESRNHDLVHSNTLDLHELHVNEAIQVLDNVLQERQGERRSPNNKRSPSYLQVITGRGNRSRDGKPRIKPAVVDYLKRYGYRYEELNSGLYKVFLN